MEKMHACNIMANGMECMHDSKNYNIYKRSGIPFPFVYGNVYNMQPASIYTFLGHFEVKSCNYTDVPRSRMGCIEAVCIYSHSYIYTT